MEAFSATRRSPGDRHHVAIKFEDQQNSMNSTSGNLLNALSSRRQRAQVLSIYKDPPSLEISVDDFEESGYQRLMILRAIEDHKARKTTSSAEMSVSIDKLIRQYNMNDPQWDNLGHHVLRLAYSRTEDLRRWLLSAECSLFKMRFETDLLENQAKFVKENDFPYERATLTPELLELLRNNHGKEFMANTKETFYCVPWENASELFRKQSVIIQKGWAYVSIQHLSTLVVSKFRSHLSLELAHIQRFMTFSGMDERIQRAVISLARQTSKASMKSTSIEGEVTLAQLPTLATSPSFPLCMSKLYNAAKTENHLKHGGRMQFGLFLKGIGLSLNDSLAFWRTAFARRTPPEKFDKEYAYTIRHNYGKEGKRTNYSPYGCMKIIHSMPALGDHHGCPFKHSDEGALRASLRQRGLDKDAIHEVLTLVSNQHFQVACARVFALTHNGEVADGVGTHPNSYFEASQRLISAGAGGKESKDTTEVVTNSPGVAE